MSTGTTGTTARSTTTVTNKDTQTRYLHVRTDRYNYNDLRVDDSANSTGTVDPGYVRIASIPRASGSYVYDYIHTGTARRGITVQDYLVDSYSYKAKQYY